MTKKNLSVLMIMIASIFAGCAGIPVPGVTSDPYEGLSQEGRDNLLLRESDKIRVHNAALENYLYGVLAKLHSEDLLKEKNIRVALVADSNPGAHVAPDGLVIWHLATFWYLESEDEIAAMLAHEMAHLTAGHHETSETGSMMDKFMAAGETAAVFSGAGSVLELWAATNSVRWASDSVLFPSFTREEETAADVEAARVLVEAGYNADAVRVMLGKLRNSYGDQAEFVSQEMVHVTKQKNGNTSQVSFMVDSDAVLGNLTGYVKNRWGQQYESFTDREAAVREVLMTEYPQRNRSPFKTRPYNAVIGAGETKSWLDSHKVGLDAANVDIQDEKDFEKFRSLTEQMMGDTQTTEVFDYHMLLNAAMRNGFEEQAAKLGLYLISLDQAILEHYLIAGINQRNTREYRQALAIFERADNIFSSAQDQTLVPLILATKDDAGFGQGNTALRCLDPSLTMACLKRK